MLPLLVKVIAAGNAFVILRALTIWPKECLS